MPRKPYGAGRESDWTMPADRDLAYCHANLPNAGLGNKLLVWAKAYVFSRLNQVPLHVSGWSRLHLAPMLHGDFRFYWNYFQPSREAGRATLHAGRGWKVIAEPPVGPIDPGREVIYEYSTVPSWKDFFGDIRAHRTEVRKALMAMLTPARMKELGRQHAPAIAVHVRMGDFLKLKPGQRFDQVGNTRTPLEYFRNLIGSMQRIHGSVLPVEILSDGRKEELGELLDLPNVSLAPKRTAIVDILTMSRSRILICSAGSTFSYWAGFLGDCALVLHPDHMHAPVRPEEVNRNYYEGPLAGSPESWPRLFLDNLRSIRTVEEPHFSAR
jgi:hypothetical protein